MLTITCSHALFEAEENNDSVHARLDEIMVEIEQFKSRLITGEISRKDEALLGTTESVDSQNSDICAPFSTDELEESDESDEFLDTELVSVHESVSTCDKSAIYDHVYTNTSAIGLDELLLIAANYGREDTVRLLLDMGADVDAVDNDGQPVLIVAARKGYRRVCEILIECGGNIEAKDRYGENGLMFAAVGGHERVVELFLENNANVRAENRHGWTALELADRKGVKNTVRLLKQRQRKHGKRIGRLGI
jgi:ankyrin repeat protein